MIVSIQITHYHNIIMVVNVCVEPDCSEEASRIIVEYMGKVANILHIKNFETFLISVP